MRCSHVLQIACLFFEAARVVLAYEEGAWTEWSQWTSCSVTCGYGLQKRQKTWQPSQPTGGNQEPFKYEDILDCTTNVPCPRNGTWGYWGAWSECTKMCGTGTTTRRRECNAPAPENGGKDCEGENFATVECNEWVCPPLPVNLDVRECNETMFMCLSELQCVPTANRCDNKLECHDGSDEHQCQYFYYGHSFSSAHLSEISFLLACLLVTIATVFIRS